MNTVQFFLAEGTRLLDYGIEIRRDFMDELDRSDHNGRAAIVGALEGEAVFSVAADPLSLYSTVHGCKDALLDRLGLQGDALTLEQERLRGWIIGLLDSLANSVYQPTDEGNQ